MLPILFSTVGFSISSLTYQQTKGYWITRSTTQFQGLRTRLSHHFIFKRIKKLGDTQKLTCLRLISVSFCFQVQYQVPDLKNQRLIKPLLTQQFCSYSQHLIFCIILKGWCQPHMSSYSVITCQTPNRPIQSG